MVKTILTFVIVFGILVVVHEFGHFFFARRAGILVREFAIGMGPKLFSYRDSKGTTYTIRLLPVGGYVRMAGWGEDSSEISPGTALTLVLNEHNVVQKINLSKKVLLENGLPFEVESVDLEKELFVRGYVNGDERELVTYSVDHDATLIEETGTELRIAPLDVQMQSVSVPKRILTNFAGPMNNFILGIVLFILLAFFRGGSPVTDTNQIGEVLRGSVAAKAGLKENDRIEKINGKKVSTWAEMQEKIEPNAGKKVMLTVKRGEKNFSVQLIPKSNGAGKEKVGSIGVVQPLDKNFFSGILFGGVKTAFSMSVRILQALGGLFTGFSLNKLGGPVMMFQMSKQASEAGIISVISLMAMLSMNLGFVNLFPIPALDGGKIVLNVIEGIRKKPMSREKEGMLTIAGAAVVFLLMIAVTWNDIVRFFMK